MVYLSWILVWFEAFSGLKINLEKSSIFPVGRVENLEELAKELGCISGSLPTTYLGLPLGAKHNSTTVWDGVEERFKKRLALWKRQYLHDVSLPTAERCEVQVGGNSKGLSLCEEKNNSLIFIN